MGTLLLSAVLGKGSVKRAFPCHGNRPRHQERRAVSIAGPRASQLLRPGLPRGVPLASVVDECLRAGLRCHIEKLLAYVTRIP